MTVNGRVNIVASCIEFFVINVYYETPLTSNANPY